MRLIFPILNKGVELFELPAWFLSETISVLQIHGEDYLTLHRDDEDLYVPMVSAKTTCIYVEGVPPEGADSFARKLCTLFQFVFKTFSTNPLLLSHAALLEQVDQTKARLFNSFDLLMPRYKDAPAQSFAFNEGTRPEEVNKWYSIVSQAVAKHEPMQITLGRFNSCLLRNDPFDQIIDLTISMESLIQSSVELKFKFALFHSFLSQRSPAPRAQTFAILKDLYDARSSIVHGDSATRSAQRKITDTIARIPELIRLAHASINYYSAFIFENSIDKWSAHLEGLIIGSVNPITE